MSGVRTLYIYRSIFFQSYMDDPDKDIEKWITHQHPTENKDQELSL